MPPQACSACKHTARKEAAYSSTLNSVCPQQHLNKPVASLHVARCCRVLLCRPRPAVIAAVPAAVTTLPLPLLLRCRCCRCQPSCCCAPYPLQHRHRIEALPVALPAASRPPCSLEQDSFNPARLDSTHCANCPQQHTSGRIPLLTSHPTTFGIQLLYLQTQCISLRSAITAPAGLRGHTAQGW